jgi:hypothetical protein
LCPRGQALLFATTVSVLAISADSFHAQTDGTCVPVSERAGREFGCFITAREELGALPAQPPRYGHLDTFPTAAAARAAKGPHGSRRVSGPRLVVHDRRRRISAGSRLTLWSNVPIVVRGETLVRSI